MSERGMKKWAPYASLIEQKGVMAAMFHEKRKIKRPHLSADQGQLIDRKLREYQGETLNITYFDDGFIHTIHAPIDKIDSNKRLLVIGDISISFNNLLSLDD